MENERGIWETVHLIDSWYSECKRQVIYLVQRGRDGRYTALNESSIRGEKPPQAVKAALEAGETVDIDIISYEPPRWTQQLLDARP